MTPGRFWEASDAATVVDGVLLGQWFEPSDEIKELLGVETASVGQRHRVGYRLRVENLDGQHVCRFPALGPLDWPPHAAPDRAYCSLSGSTLTGGIGEHRRVVPAERHACRYVGRAPVVVSASRPASLSCSAKLPPLYRLATGCCCACSSVASSGPEPAARWSNPPAMTPSGSSTDTGPPGPPSKPTPPIPRTAPIGCSPSVPGNTRPGPPSTGPTPAWKPSPASRHPQPERRPTNSQGNTSRVRSGPRRSMRPPGAMMTRCVAAPATISRPSGSTPVSPRRHLRPAPGASGGVRRRCSWRRRRSPPPWPWPCWQPWCRAGRAATPGRRGPRAHWRLFAPKVEVQTTSLGRALLASPPVGTVRTGQPAAPAATRHGTDRSHRLRAPGQQRIEFDGCRTRPRHHPTLDFVTGSVVADGRSAHQELTDRGTPHVGSSSGWASHQALRWAAAAR